MISIALLLFMFSMLSAFAANGSLTFSHGVIPSSKTTYGATYSTVVENSMSFVGYVKFFSGPNNGQTAVVYSPTQTLVKEAAHAIYVGPYEGYSLFKYYVNSTLEHTSTDWWDFDFS